MFPFGGGGGGWVGWGLGGFGSMKRSGFWSLYGFGVLND